MKKWINYKSYDTDTAEKIGSWSADLTSEERTEETLYRKKTGEYFIHGSGGALSKYAKSKGNETLGSEKIIPVSYEDAQQWAADHLEKAEYEKEFGEISKKEGKVRIQFYISAAKAERLKREAGKKGLSFSDYMESIL